MFIIAGILGLRGKGEEEEDSGASRNTEGIEMGREYFNYWKDGGLVGGWVTCSHLIMTVGFSVNHFFH